MANKSFKRMDRINKQLQRELALILETRIKKNSVKDAIITGVECSSDLEKARVFFTVLCEGEGVKANADNISSSSSASSSARLAKRRKHLKGELQAIKGVLRSLLGQAVRLRRVPDLEFIPDTSSDYGAKIDEILNRLGLIDNSNNLDLNLEDKNIDEDILNEEDLDLDLEDFEFEDDK